MVQQEHFNSSTIHQIEKGNVGKRQCTEDDNTCSIYCSL